jgi:hypothetical protein
MKNTLKKALALLVASLFLFSLVACGGADPAPPPSNGGNNTTTSTSTSPNTPHTPAEAEPEQFFKTEAYRDDFLGIDGVLITEYTGSAKDLVIPATIRGLPVVVIGDGKERIFKDVRVRENIESVYIPFGVLEIGAWAFAGSVNMKSIHIPDSVTIIKVRVFSGCTGLTSIIIPDSVTEIQGSAFSDCTGLTSIVIPDSVIKLEAGAFAECYNIEEFKIGSGIGIDDFKRFYLFNSSSLSGVIRFTVSDNNSFISSVDGVVYNKEKTAIWAFPRGFQGEFTIPDSVTSIGDYTFFDCTGLTSIVIPDSVTTIGEVAFGGCTGLTSIVIPDSVTTIGMGAFRDCTGLTSIVIPDSVTNIGGGAFEGCTGLTSVVISNSVTVIGNNAFKGCTGLTSIVIPDSVTTIGRSVFRGCSETFTAVYKGVTYSAIRNHMELDREFDLPPEFYAAINNQ